MIANLFGVGKSTVHKCIHDVCTAMAENILDKYVKFPADDDLQLVSSLLRSNHHLLIKTITWLSTHTNTVFLLFRNTVLQILYILK